MKYAALVLVFFLGAIAGNAQCTSRNISASHELHQSSFVIIGTVTGVAQVPETWDFLNGISYTVRIDRVLHGHPNRAVYNVFSEDVPNAFTMTRGMDYVLYVHPRYDRYEVTNCGNSHPTGGFEDFRAKRFTVPNHGLVANVVVASTRYLSGGSQGYDFSK